MNDNDPIKEYNPVKLKLDMVQEQFEMNQLGEEAITDLHDCSNDLSDEGSRKEEIAHEKFANMIRIKRKQDNQSKKYEIAWSIPKVNKNRKNNVGKIIMIVIIAFMLINILPFLFIFIFFITKNFENIEIMNQEQNYEVSYEEISSLEFEKYKSNISLAIYKTENDTTVVHLYNANEKSFSNVEIEIVFYDGFRNILKTEKIYCGMLIAENEHFFELYEVPSEYVEYQYNIVNSYGNYSDICKEDINLHREDYDSKSTVTLKNYTDIEMDSAEVVVAYFKENQLVDIEKSYFVDIESGEEQSNTYYVWKEMEVDEIRMTLNEVNIY